MYHTEISTLLDMVERGCRKMMKAGGGHLSQPRPECGPRKLGVRVSQDRKIAMLEIAATGKHTAADLVRLTGIRQQSIADWCRKEGIKLPCGWLGMRKRV